MGAHSFNFLFVDLKRQATSLALQNDHYSTPQPLFGFWYAANEGDMATITCDCDLEDAIHQFYDVGSLRIFAFYGDIRVPHMPRRQAPRELDVNVNSELLVRFAGYGHRDSAG
jgi:hypothetical protein